MALSSNLRDLERDKFRGDSPSDTKIAVVIEDSAASLRFEEASATVLYLAEGLFGALSSEAKWKIKKINTSSGVVILAASNSFDQIWDNRASLTYV